MDKAGTYKVTYTITVDPQALKKATNKDTDKETYTIIKEITVVDKDKAQQLANKGETVWADKNVVVKKDDKTETAKKEDTKTEDKKANEKKPEASKPAENKPASSGNSSSGNTASKPAESQPAGCNHNWVAQTTTVHHDATGHNEPTYGTQWVQDSAAWDEPTYDLKEVTICNVCGADVTGNPSAHEKAHAMAGEGGGWHSDWQQVQTGSIHHDATGHNEQVQTGSQWVQDSAAWDETVTTGYKCSKCGATK